MLGVGSVASDRQMKTYTNQTDAHANKHTQQTHTHKKEFINSPLEMILSKTRDLNACARGVVNTSQSEDERNTHKKVDPDMYSMYIYAWMCVLYIW